ncbi:C2 calcium-dependent domain-containing protein 4C-like [Cyclopterus lumpus]|uniref:C2 calcium-dependent domain-containing protein 4C-like n=1 Tax=Cyclopterus lumpus TaxID=8103 RepID=UPI0014860BE9|nr:C2 calcium-dependent domain-containing protein 4C-like [Cyclopterus lumpus]
MWVFEKIRESIPLELSRYLGKSEEDIFRSSQASLSHHLHNNILTPDKIPEFCLPPRLRKSSSLLEAETVSPYRHRQHQMPKSSTSSNTTYVKTKDMKTKNGGASMAWKATKKPLPFSAEGYGLAGIYESPNTRRKESLFHSKCPVYMFDRSLPTAAPRLAEATNLPKKTLSVFFPLFSSKSLSEIGSTGSEIPSSSDFSTLSSPYSMFGIARTYFSMSMFFLCRVGVRFISSLSTAHSPLARVHPHTTVRVLVVSVEGLWDDSDRRTLNCAVHLCLTPGKLQQQESATIRNCRSPVFNENFFFTELTREDLLKLQLWLKVMYKPTTGILGRGTVIGATTKPLSQLLSLKKWAKE